MDRQSSNSRQDAPGALYAAGQRVQALALTMLKHQIAPGLGVCKSCGRLPARELPTFGPRCEIAVEEWDVAQAVLRHLVIGLSEQQAANRVVRNDMTRVIGRASVPRKKILVGKG